MTDAGRKPWYQKLPAKVGAGVVFLVALTTLIGNVLELIDKRRAEAPVSTPAAAASASARDVEAVPATAAVAKPAAPGVVNVELQLDRIVVRHDGTVGTTDWRFAVEGDGEPLFVFSQDDLDDTGGRNVALPKDARTWLRLAEGTKLKLAVKGWRRSRFRLPNAKPDAVGEGDLAGDGAVAQIVVAAAEPGDSEFVFRFSATRVE
jgi:hypothetical protein